LVFGIGFRGNVCGGLERLLVGHGLSVGLIVIVTEVTGLVAVREGVRLVLLVLLWHLVLVDLHRLIIGQVLLSWGWLPFLI
jgi:hypothetical protein